VPKQRAIVAAAKGEIQIPAAAIQLQLKILLSETFAFWTADFNLQHWQEWNGRFRANGRHFLKGDAGLAFSVSQQGNNKAYA
jgi:hypothetical protein